MSVRPWQIPCLDRERRQGGQGMDVYWPWLQGSIIAWGVPDQDSRLAVQGRFKELELWLCHHLEDSRSHPTCLTLLEQTGYPSYNVVFIWILADQEDIPVIEISWRRQQWASWLYQGLTAPNNTTSQSPPSWPGCWQSWWRSCCPRPLSVAQLVHC